MKNPEISEIAISPQSHNPTIPEFFHAFALTSPFVDLDSDVALELAELAAELAARRGGVVASADCDLRGFWDFGVANFGALKRAISFLSSVFLDCTPCNVSFGISFSRIFLSNSF